MSITTIKKANEILLKTNIYIRSKTLEVQNHNKEQITINSITNKYFNNKSKRI